LVDRTRSITVPVVTQRRFSLKISPSVGAAHAPYLRRHLRAAHRLLNPPLAELSLALVGDRKMSDLHRQFMNLPGPTDVLTFPLDLDARGRPVSGEVVVCVPEARRQAKERNVPLERELLLYALHGMLHLCGYDDRTDRAFRTMHRTEDRILTRLGVGPVFAPAADTQPAALGKRKARRKPHRKAASRGGAH
jgi:probable rRNA maturation factor